ncbi:RHS repeat-associated core domain-containing protein [Rhodanobacter sp. UC4451_H18]
MNTWQKIALAVLMLAAGQLHAEDAVHYYYTDPQGTVLAKADATGNVIATYDYAPYGSQALGMPPSGPGYTGHVNDPDTGLVYMQARYYDPATGRFLSTDPVGPSPGSLFHFNRYDYANDNPYRYTDPDGRCADGLSCDTMVQSFGGQPSSPQAAELAASALPVVGDAVNIAEAIKNPSALTITAAVIGVVPEGAVVGKALKGVAKLFGKAQKTFKAGKETMHAATSEGIAAKELTRTDAVSVNLNQTITTATDGEVKSALRPDVQTVRTDGKVDVHEVLSPGQNANASAAKYTNALGDKAGTVKCVPQDKC